MTDKELYEAWPEFIHPDGSWRLQRVRETQLGTNARWNVYVETGDRQRIGRRKHPMVDSGRPPHLERADLHPNDFQTDEQAWRHVWKLAREGSDAARAALLYIRHKNPQEYAQIRAYCTR